MTDHVEDFPKLSQNNREDIKDGTSCGCYFCLSTFKGSKIEEWVADSTALCPNCGIDSVVVLTAIIKEEDLSRGLERWFTGEAEELPYAEDYHPEIKISFNEEYSQEYIARLMEVEGPMAAEILWSGYATGYLTALKHKKSE